MSFFTPHSRPAAFLLLLLLPIGCLLVQDGEAEPVAAALSLKVFQPPFGPGVVPVDSVTLSREGGVVRLSSGTDITVPEDAFVTAEGQPVAGPVTLTIREFLNPIETWLEGVPMNMGDDAVLRSAGMMEIRGTTANGEQVELAPDKALQLRLVQRRSGPRLRELGAGHRYGAMARNRRSSIPHHPGPRR